VSAGEAFARDLQPPAPVATPLPPPAAPSPTPSVPVTPRPSTKRTFRLPRELDAELKRFVHRYNLEKRDDEPELTMDEVGVVMARYFLETDPGATTHEARGIVA
jgi:hypothetical protein